MSNELMTMPDFLSPELVQAELDAQAELVNPASLFPRMRLNRVTTQARCARPHWVALPEQTSGSDGGMMRVDSISPTPTWSVAPAHGASGVALRPGMITRAARVQPAVSDEPSMVFE